MFKLRRMYFDSIGVTDNRLVDLTVDVTGLDGSPIDSIVWARNGTGKTMMLSLLLSLIRPHRDEFLATRITKRTLEDIVNGGDVAHVAAEWADPHGQLLCTGAVYEWDGRVKPRDPNGENRRLKKLWWVITPDPTVEGATLDDLPFTLRSGGKVDREGFRSHVQSLRKRGVNATFADNNIGAWHAALRERRFDPDLYKYFNDVNASEGGLDKLFVGVNSAEEFVRYLLKFVGDAERLAPVKGLLNDTAGLIAKRPSYLVDREFCTEARPLLEALGHAHARVVGARQTRDLNREVAGAYRRALQDTADGADSLAGILQARYDELEAARAQAETDARRARERRSEYDRYAAAFRVKDAEAALATARQAATDADLAEQAWQATDALAAIADADAVLAIRRDAITSAAEDAAPKLAAVEAARGRLAHAIDLLLVDLETSIDDLGEAITAATTERAAADTARASAQAEDARLETERAGLIETVDRHEAKVRTATNDGHLHAGEPPTAALARHTARIAELDDLIVAAAERITALEVDLAADQQHEADTRAEHAQTRADADADATKVAELRSRAQALAALPVLHEIAQGDDIDCFAEGPTLIAGLRELAANAGAEVLQLRLDGASDDIALAALEAEPRLLPVRTSVTAVVEALKARGVTAHPGWHYLAKNEPVDAHAELMARHPGLVDGVVVYGDPGRAAAVLDELDVDELVVIGAATAFRAVTAEQLHVVGPNPARHDTSSAAEEATKRRANAAGRGTQISRAAGQQDAAVQLASELRTLLDAVEPHGIGILEARAADLAEDCDRLASDVAAAAAVTADARAALQAAKDRHIELAGERSHESISRTAVRSLAEDEADHIVDAKARIAAIPSLRTAAAEAVTAANATYHAAGERLDDAKDQQRGLKATRSELTAERAPLGVAAADSFTVEAERAGLAEADRLFREAFPEAELRRHAEDAAKAVADLNRQLRLRYETTVRAAAEALVADDPAANDDRLRNERITAARQRAVTATSDLGRADTDLTDARAEFAEHDPPPGRPRRQVTLAVEPVDRADARRLAGEAEAEAARHQARLNEHGEAAAAARRGADRARQRAAMLRDQDDKLADVDVGEFSVDEIPADDDAVRSEVGQLTSDVKASESAWLSAVQARSGRADALRSWASGDRFLAISDSEHGQAIKLLRGLFTGDTLFDLIAPNAAGHLDDLRQREHLIGVLLAEIDEHKRNVTSRLAGHVAEALTDLGRASSLSELKEGIGPWAGHRFLVVEARQKPTPEQIDVRVSDIVEKMVAGGKLEIEVTELLWRAVDAACPGGFKATILKPDPAQPTTRTPVEHMTKWSGGENLTATLVLFCVMCRLRSEKRTGVTADAAGGLMPLDNPLGKANYVPFLELQRKVAATNGVQLVFFTGITDLSSVTVFPRVAAMRKRPALNRPTHAYLQVDDERSYTRDIPALEVVHGGRRDT